MELPASVLPEPLELQATAPRAKDMLAVFAARKKSEPKLRMKGLPAPRATAAS
jgi:hypothetical protein